MKIVDNFTGNLIIRAYNELNDDGTFNNSSPVKVMHY